MCLIFTFSQFSFSFFFFFYSFASSLFPAHQFHLLCLFLFFSISSILIFIWNSSPYLPLHLFLFHCLSRPLYLPLIYLHLLSSFLLVLAVLSSFHRCLYLILLSSVSVFLHFFLLRVFITFFILFIKSTFFPPHIFFFVFIPVFSFSGLFVHH